MLSWKRNLLHLFPHDKLSDIFHHYSMFMKSLHRLQSLVPHYSRYFFPCPHIADNSFTSCTNFSSSFCLCGKNKNKQNKNIWKRLTRSCRQHGMTAMTFAILSSHSRKFANLRISHVFPFIKKNSNLKKMKKIYKKKNHSHQRIGAWCSYPHSVDNHHHLNRSNPISPYFCDIANEIDYNM